MGTLAGWNYRKKLTHDHTLIDSDLSGFPAFAKLTSGNFDFTKALANGHDIRLTKADGTTLLNYERERHDNSGEKGEYHFDTVALSSSADQDFYLYYGKADATDGENGEAVWDSNFKMVQHMNQDPSGGAPQMIDSTSNDNDGTSAGSMTSGDLVEGKVGQCLEFDGSNDYINFGQKASLKGCFDPGDKFTIELIAKPTLATGGNWRWFVSKPYTSHSSPYYQIDMFHAPTNELRAAIRRSDLYGNYLICTCPDGSVPLNEWSYLAMIADLASTNLKTYIDDDAVVEDDTAEGSYTNYDTDFTVGANKNVISAQYNYGGLIDEVRVSDINRSEAWKKATYNSLWDNLFTFGAEEELIGEGGANAIFFGMN